jgi:tetratricopeptide (TPR) repeat protein
MHWDELPSHRPSAALGDRPSPPPGGRWKVWLAWLVGVALVVGLVWWWWYSNDHLARGKEALKARDYDRAVDHFTRLIEKDRSQPEGYAYRATVHLRRWEFQKARDDGDALIAKGWVTGYVLKGHAYLLQEDYDGALAQFDQATREGARVDGHVGSAWAHLFRNELSEAEAEAESARRNDPKSADAIAALGAAAARRRDYEAALKYDDRVIALEPDDGPGYAARAEDYRRLGKDDLARADLGRAVQLDPKGPSGYEVQALLQLGVKDYDGALQNLDRAVELTPWRAFGYQMRGAVHYYRKDYSQALRELDEALRRSPRSTNVLSWRASTYVKLGRYSQARADAEKAIELNPRSEDGYLALAWICAACPDASFRSGAEAVKNAQHAGELLQVKDPYVLEALAAAYAESGDFEAAVRSQKEALAAPGFVLADEKEQGRRKLANYEKGKPWREVD